MNTEVLLAVLPWLAILACPVVMIWMMRGMQCNSRGQEHASGGRAERGAAAAEVPGAEVPGARVPPPAAHPAGVEAGTRGAPMRISGA